jgi:hypothetical protein
MADNAFQTMYRQEFIKGFEQRQSLLRQTVTTEADIQAQSAVFLVADSNSATAKTRGANGLIPARADNETQYTATLVEWHDLVRKNRYNIYAGQGDKRKIMQMTTMAVLNRKIDSDILTALANCTLGTGTAVNMTLALAMHAVTILGNNAVPLDGNICGVISPAAHAYMMQTKEFASADYVNNKPFSGMLTMFRWASVNWIVHPNISGIGTSAEELFVYHKDSMGHACDTNGLNMAVGYNDEQDYSYARASSFMGSKLLQNTGIVNVNHDGSGFAAGSA